MDRWLAVGCCLLMGLFTTDSHVAAGIELPGLLAQVAEPGERPRPEAFVESMLPRVEGGKPIDPERKGLAYVAAVMGFLLAFVIALFAIRMLASLSILVAFLGSLILLCLMVYHDSIQTWRQLAVSTSLLAVANAAYAAIAILFGKGRS